MARKDLFLHADAEGKAPSFIVSDDPNDPVFLGVEGIYSLVGRVMRILFTTPGSWPANIREGSPIAYLQGGLYDPVSVRADIARSVIEVEDLIKRSQALRNTPLNESLSSLEVVSIVMPTPGHVVVTLLVSSISGEAALTTAGV